jgi:AraC family transcriptional regulator
MSGMLGAQQGEFGRVTVFDIKEPLAEHAHPHIHFLFKLEGSDRALRVGAENVVLGAGNCLLISPWQRHADIADRSTGPTVMLALYIEIGFMETHFGALPAPVFAAPTAPLTADTRRLVAELRQLVTTGRGDPARIETAIAELIDGVFASAATADHGRAGISDYRIRRALALLSESPHLHPDFHTLASSVGLSRSRFFEQFKASLGIAPTMYVDGLLLEQAIDMLVYTDTTIEAISASARLGFAAQSSFSRFFKDRVGFPPLTLRQAAASLAN